MIDDFLVRWNLTRDGESLAAQSRILVPVRYERLPAMLKIATEPLLRLGAESMVSWSGDGDRRLGVSTGGLPRQRRR